MSDFTDLQKLQELALAIIRRAAAIARESRDSLEIETKTNRNDLVTVVDKQIEEFIAAELAKYTDYPLLGEENHVLDSWSGRVWVLDPIDGTMNFVATHRDYAISLALCEDAKPIMAVIADVESDAYYTAIVGQGAYKNGVKLDPVSAEAELTEAIIITDVKEVLALPRLAQAIVDSRGQRRYGSAALEITEVALGQAGAFLHLRLSPWDIAAAILLCTEVGAVVTRLDGAPIDLRYPGSALAAWPKVHQELVQRLFLDPACR